MTESALAPDVVAIDGPAGSGKSSVSKEVARRLGFGFLDTGAAYRALAWAALDRGTDTHDDTAIAALAGAAVIVVGLDPDDARITVDGVDVTTAIREPRVSAAVSAVARVPSVRVTVNALFHRLIDADPRPGVVVEGRDITTVVVPDAPVRILLTASPEVRAARRSAQLAAPDSAEVAEAITRRDAADSKVSDFLDAAPGVTVVDSTALDFEQTVTAVIAVVDSKTGGRHGR